MRYIFLILSILIIGINGYLIYHGTIEESRWGRITCSASFLLIYLTKISSKNILVLGSLICLLMADFFTLNFNEPFSQKAYYALHSFTYMLLLFHLRFEIERPIFSAFQKIYFSMVLVMNLFLALAMGNILAEEINDSNVLILFYGYCLSAILLISGAIIYYDRRIDSSAAIFFLSAFGLVLSNVLAFPAHYLEYKYFLYLDRALYVTGIASLVYFTGFLRSNSRKSQNENVSQTEENKDSRFYHEV